MPNNAPRSISATPFNLGQILWHIDLCTILHIIYLMLMTSLAYCTCSNIIPVTFHSEDCCSTAAMVAAAVFLLCSSCVLRRISTSTVVFLLCSSCVSLETYG